MKKLAFAAALGLVAVAPAAHATGYVQPQVEEVVIVQDTAASNQGIFVPVFALLLLLLLHHGGGSATPVQVIN